MSHRNQHPMSRRNQPLTSSTMWVGIATVAIMVLCSGCPEDVGFVDDFPANCSQEPVFTMLSPSQGQTVAADFQLLLEVSHFDVSEENYGEANQDCQGHFHVFFGDVNLPAAKLVDTVVDINEFPDGEYEFRVEVHNNDHSTITEIDFLQVTVTKETTQ